MWNGKLFTAGRPRAGAHEMRGRAVDKVAQRAVAASGKVVAQVSNLLYRRFPIGGTSKVRGPFRIRRARRLEALRYGRLGNLRYNFVNGPESGSKIVFSLNPFSVLLWVLESC